MLRKNKLLIFTLFCQLLSVWCQNDLVFVIDDTGSMMDDIDQVKTQVDELFDAAVNSNSSEIVDFIIVTFNDPEFQHRATTNNREVFKAALNAITVNGGDDCPEMALSGLELALKKSRDKSLVYLFTDASAKDSEKLEAVKALALEKKCRLFFMLTGNCFGDQDRSFIDLAEATGGQVFSLFKKEVGQMLGHARETVAGGYAADVPLAASSYAVDSDAVEQTRNTSFVLDDTKKEALVSVSAHNPEVQLTGPDGNTPKTVEVVKTSGSKVLKILDAKPGTYIISVKSEGPSSVLVNTKLD